MANDHDDHLTPDVLNRIVTNRASDSEQAAAKVHWMACADCAARLSGYRDAEERLESLRFGTNLESGEGCPEAEEWVRLDSGELPEARANDMLDHAAACGPCSAQLRAVLDEQSEASVPKERLLAGVQTVRHEVELPTEGNPLMHEPADDCAPSVPRISTREWPTSITEKMSDSVGIATSVRRRLIPQWPAAAGVVLAIGLGSLWYLRARSEPPNELLAKAYTEQRTLALRFPGARYGPIRTERGGAPSSLLRPPELLDGEQRIARGLAAHPDNPAWLDSKGRADLLDWNYEAAIESLTRAQALAPESVAILTDLSSAYFERAENLKQAADYGAAIELLSRVLSSSPKDVVARFNRAVMYEKLALLHESAADWEQYLRVDSSGAWADEARQNLQRVRQKLSKGSLVPVDPEPSDPSVIERLAEAFVDSAPGVLRSKLLVAAASDAEMHADLWMQDLLVHSVRPEFPRVFQHLHYAVRSNQNGDPSLAESEARLSLAGFEKIGNLAGALRSRFEIAYALQRSSKGAACLEEAQILESTTGLRQYPWLRTQVLLTMASCSNMTGELATAETAALKALRTAESHQLPILRLRALGISAAVLTTKGRWREAWDLDRSGLEIFWTANYPPIRAYQFYDDMSISAEREGRLHIAAALAREASLQIAQTENRSGEAMARYKLARLALAINSFREAREQFIQADSIFAAMPPGEAITIYRANGEIGLAQAEAQSGDSQGALERLRRMEPNLAAFSNQMVAVRFYQALYEVEDRVGDHRAGEKALRALVNIAEKGLSSLASDRDRLAWVNELDRGYRGLVRVALERGDTEEALNLWEWYRAADLQRPTLSQAGGPGVLDFTTLSNSAPRLQTLSVTTSARSLHEATAVVYVELPDGVAAWSYDDRGTVFRWLPISSTKLEPLAHNFAEACANVSSTADARNGPGHSLYRQLVAPLASSWVENRILLLELDGVLASLPFDAIPAPDGVPLGARFTMALSPGTHHRERVPVVEPLTGPVAAVADPQLSSAITTLFPPLPDAITEAEDVAALFAGGEVLSGSNATPAAVRDQLMRARIFHFAGHAVSSSERTGLLLAGARSASPTDPAFWDSRALQSNSLRNCRLVVLSACSTGRLGPQGLNEPDSLARSFLAAGVEHVVASRWSVDSRVTRKLMVEFYTELHRGSSVEAALRAASQSIRRRPETSHPYYWAAFAVFGES